MSDPEKLEKITKLLLQAAHPRRILVFGSHAKGEARDDSDLDILVVEEKVPDRAAEIVRLNRILSPPSSAGRPAGGKRRGIPLLVRHSGQCLFRGAEGGQGAV